jgi:hypothetical protein
VLDTKRIGSEPNLTETFMDPKFHPQIPIQNRPPGPDPDEPGPDVINPLVDPTNPPPHKI